MIVVCRNILSACVNHLPALGMVKPSVCSSMRAPRRLVVGAFLVIGCLVLIMIARTSIVLVGMGQDGPGQGPRGYVPGGYMMDSFEEPASIDFLYVQMDGCGHCRAFDPTWSKFVEKYGTALAAVGVTTQKLQNDDPRAKLLGLTGYPSILLVHKTGADPTMFNGPRTVDALANFLHANVPSFSP